jgi:MFS transporter, SP family, general alpha glucoside:H+ symporter
MSERAGYRWTLILALTALIGFIFIPFYGCAPSKILYYKNVNIVVAKTLTVFLVGELLQGISWGVFQVRY